MFDGSRRELIAGSLLAALGAGLPGRALGTSQAPAPRFPTALEATFAAAFDKAQVVGAGLTLLRDGEVAGSYSHGRASIPFNIPVSEETLFHTGSVGKHVTAIGIVQLAQAGRLAIDQPVGRVVSGLPDWLAAIPIHNLLCHTGGVPDYEQGFDWDRPFTRETLLKSVTKPDFAPGEAWSYSNSGYLLLGYALEAASGLSYGEYVRQKLFEPAGLPLARVDAAGSPIAGRAEPYQLTSGKSAHALRMESGVSGSADGGLLFSARDWAPWERAVTGNRLAEAASMAAMYRPDVLRSGRSAGYGYGWFVDQVRGKPVHSHSGGVPGFITYVLRYPAARLFAVVTMNSEPKGRIAPLLEQTIEAYAPGMTYLGLAARPDAKDREQRLLAFFGGDSSDRIVAPELLAGDAARKRKPGPRLVGVSAIGLLERYKVPGGEMARYRVTAKDVELTLLIGWSDDGRIFMAR
ncbi:serine hydrolase domain-containing protein [Sphingomonas soli]|uniref:serine hydrolase domain-containing protein n=1 Tax=Sphingomonas soli TaxID=266127 RepID=UPI00082F6E9F|nr:serine hydrolase domain-containing protein [Sphingomonas soli]